MAKFKKDQIINRAINQRYLDDIEEVTNNAIKMLAKRNDNAKLNELKGILYNIKVFADSQTYNRPHYQELKDRANNSKHQLATILLELNLIDNVELREKVERVEQENKEIKQENKEIKQRQDRQEAEIAEIKENNRKFQDTVLSEIRSLREDNTENHRQLNNTNDRVSEIESEIKTIKQDLASIKSQLSAHVEDKIKSNPSQFARMLEREIPKDSPMYNQQEYDQIMKILDGLENKDIIDQCKNTINESLFKFAPKLVEALIDGYLHRKDFALKYKYLKQVDSASATELCKAALSSIGKLNPSSETVGMVLDGVKAAGYGALMIRGIIDGKITDSRVRKSYVREADRITEWFNQRLRSQSQFEENECYTMECSDPNFFGEYNIYSYKFSLKDIVEKYHSFIWENYKTLNLEEWSKFLKSSVIPKIKDQYQEISLKEISQKFLYYIAAFEKGQFSEYSLLNGRIVNSYEGYGANLRKALMPRTQKHADEILEKMHSVSVLKLYALYNLSSFAEHCYEVIVNNSIIPLSKMDGQSQESRNIFLENFDKRCLARSSGYCNFETFVILETFMREGTMPVATISNTIETSDIITATVDAAANTFQNHEKKVTTRATIENNEINPIVEIEGLEGYDIQRSRSNSRG